VFRTLFVGSLATIGLVGCGSTATPVPTQAPTSAPTYTVSCSFVLTAAGSEVGLVVNIPGASADSSVWCPKFRAAIDNNNTNNAFTVSESDGVALDFTTAGPDIVVGCSVPASNGTIKVYQHSSDPVSVTLGQAMCNGLAGSAVSAT
jgi:hypothetical protein